MDHDTNELTQLRAFARRVYLAHCTPGCEALPFADEQGGEVDE